MAASIITTEDLRDFKLELIEDINKLLHKQSQGRLKKYLKSSDLMDLLQISPGTLQNLRVNGTIPYTKVGGIIFYEADEIHKVMDANRIHHNSK
ncbi:helix-turn-helix domain-containing protein [Tamlana sp. 2_MG-2023]|uniref:helix-turn-helix domain-containing protein n=1 Tax=unclassified Tamlana TaxID=2614803 RepID=UPI0026E35508|nr:MULTISPECIES: helix-turn-helix domain-containing protein [unclassified Tamlana]MDO6761625.1 helix-turn-helix domain-containing protein [Tamlana sp. 2_MG-2023]MDO6792451.1 helix-turn-helix domain-containing protein [Tamlana sp. 1_MG-2023]